MDKVTKYLSDIGKKGGKKSKRVLTSEQAKEMVRIREHKKNKHRHKYVFQECLIYGDNQVMGHEKVCVKCGYILSMWDKNDNMLVTKGEAVAGGAWFVDMITKNNSAYLVGSKIYKRR